LPQLEIQFEKKYETTDGTEAMARFSKEINSTSSLVQSNESTERHPFIKSTYSLRYISPNIVVIVE
jgi:hypothetical protein